MLTPKKISQLIKETTDKHTKPIHGLYPPQKKIMSYVSKKINQIQRNHHLTEVNKVKEMTNLLEGFIRYLNDTSTILKLDVEKILTYIYYPETEESTLGHKDNLLIGVQGKTVRSWHDNYFMNNRGSILNCLIDCKNVLYNHNGSNDIEYMDSSRGEMPEQMKKEYEKMLHAPS